MFTLMFILLTFCLAYNRSHNVLWFKLQRLFDVLPVTSISSISTSQDGMHIVAFTNSGEGYLYKFYSEYSISSKAIYRIVRIIFSLTFASCIVAIEIVLAQIKDMDSPTDGTFVAKFVWPLISISLYISLILVQPFLILFCLLDKFFDDKMQISRSAMLTTVLSITWITLLHLLNYGPFGHTTNLLTKLSIIGVTIMSLLSGIASVSNPYYAIVYMLRKKKSDHSISIKGIIPDLWLNEQTICGTIAKYEERLNELLQKLNLLQHSTESNDPILKEKLIEELGRYQLELAKLRNKAKEPKLKRFFKRLFQSIFLLYCVFKILNVFLIRIPPIFKHTWVGDGDPNYEEFNASQDRDPLAITLANALDFFLFRFHYQQELDSLIKQISLILSISLFVCSLSTVTTTISSLLTLLPVKLQVFALFTLHSRGCEPSLPAHKNEVRSSQEQPSIIKNLLVSELVGVYILATILMIRSNLPFDVSTRLNDLLGESITISNVFIDIWSDEIFAFSAICTFIGINVAERTVNK